MRCWHLTAYWIDISPEKLKSLIRSDGILVHVPFYCFTLRIHVKLYVQSISGFNSWNSSDSRNGLTAVIYLIKDAFYRFARRLRVMNELLILSLHSWRQFNWSDKSFVLLLFYVGVSFTTIIHTSLSFLSEIELLKLDLESSRVF